jgi:hypothetical protein
VVLQGRQLHGLCESKNNIELHRRWPWWQWRALPHLISVRENSFKIWRIQKTVGKINKHISGGFSAAASTNMKLKLCQKFLFTRYAKCGVWLSATVERQKEKSKEPQAAPAVTSDHLK